MSKINLKRTAYLSLILGSIFFISLSIYRVASAQLGGGDGTISSLDQWKSDGTNITQKTASKPIKITGLSDGCLGLTSSIVVSSGSACGSGSGSGAAFPFTPTTNFGVNTNATSTPVWFRSAIYASSTSAFDYASTTGLSVGSGTLYVNGPMRIPNGTVISGLLKTTGATNLVATAVAGSDYVNGVGTSGNCVKWGATNTLFDSNGSCFPFTAFPSYNATDTAMGFTAGLFSNSSTTLAGLKLTGLSAGGLYLGSDGIIVRSAATTTFTSPLTYTASTGAVTCSTCTVTGTTITVAGTANQITSSAGAQNLSANRTWTLSVPSQFNIQQASTTLLSANTAFFNNFLATSTMATSSTAGTFSVGSTSPKWTSLFYVGTTTPLFDIDKITGKIGIGCPNSGPTRWTFGCGSNANVNPSINLLVQDDSDARLGAFLSSSGIALKAGGSGVTAAGMYAYDYTGGVPKPINLQEFGSTIGINDTTPDYKFEVVGAAVNGYIGATLTNDGDLFNVSNNTTTGIGTTTPSGVAQTTIASSTTSQLALSAGGGFAEWTIRNAGGTFYLSTTSVDGLATTTAALTINNSGLGVFLGGTTTNAGVTGVAINGKSFWAGLTSSAGLQTGILCLSGVNEVINESVACVASDERAKNISGPFTGALAEISKIKPILYHYKPEFNGNYQSDPNFNGEQLGLGAAALQAIDPRLVQVYTQDGDNGVFSYNKGEAAGPKEYALITLALAGIEELDAKIGQSKKAAEDHWQWIAISMLVTWNLYLTFRKRNG